MTLPSERYNELLLTAAAYMRVAENLDKAIDLLIELRRPTTPAPSRVLSHISAAISSLEIASSQMKDAEAIARRAAQTLLSEGIE